MYRQPLIQTSYFRRCLETQQAVNEQVTPLPYWSDASYDAYILSESSGGGDFECILLPTGSLYDPNSKVASVAGVRDGKRAWISLWMTHGAEYSAEESHRLEQLAIEVLKQYVIELGLTPAFR